MKEESIQAYKTIMENGLLSERRFQFYEIIYRYGPLSITAALEIASKTIRSNNIGSQSGRFSELEALGVIETVGSQKCPKSGHEVNLWAVTGALPKKPKKRESKMKALERKNEELKGALKDAMKRNYEMMQEVKNLKRRFSTLKREPLFENID